VSVFPKPRGRVLVLAALSAAAFAYATVRTIRIPIVHDEAQTYFQFVAGPWGAGLLDPRIPGPENNNLNAILSVAAWKIFGGGDLAFRLPNLLAYPLFLVATARLALRQSTAALSVAAFLLLNANAFAVEFFSLSRGYGLGLAFLASGVAFLVGALERPGRTWVPASLGVICLGLAAYAQLSFLFPLAACAAAGFIREAWRLVSRARSPNSGSSSDPSLLIPLCISVPFLLVLVPYSMELTRLGRTFMGGVRGLWSDTVVSLLAAFRNLLPQEAPRAPLLEAALAAVLLLLAAAVVVRPARLSPLSLVPAGLLALSALGIELSCRLFGARYPVERAALGVQFLFLAAATGVAGEWIARRRSGWKPASAAVFLSAALAVAAFAAAANTTHTLLWRYDADTPRMLDDLDRAHRERGFARPVRLGITWLMEPSINYYRVRRHLAWLLPVTRFRLAAQNPDFCYWTPGDDDDARAIGLVPLAVYPTSGNRFAARVKALAPSHTPRP
jgi:hypothetical protein